MAFYTVPATVADSTLQSTDADYATMAAGAGLSIVTGEVTVGQRKTVVPSFLGWQSFLEFDTSVIPDAENVLSVSMFGFITFDESATDFIINARVFDYGTLATADWRSTVQLAALTKVATFDTTGASGVVAFTSEAAFVANINKSGMTRLVLASDRFEAGTEPTGSEYMTLVDTGSIGDGAPQLIIETDGPIVGTGRLAAQATVVSGLAEMQTSGSGLLTSQSGQLFGIGLGHYLLEGLLLCGPSEAIGGQAYRDKTEQVTDFYTDVLRT